MSSQEEELQAIEGAVRLRAGGVTGQQIAEDLPDLPQRTLQRRLKQLVDQKRLVMEGERRWTQYRVPAVEGSDRLTAGEARIEGQVSITVSPEGAAIQKYVRQPPAARTPAGYNGVFLDSYRPNVSFYLSEKSGRICSKSARRKLANSRRELSRDRSCNAS